MLARSCAMSWPRLTRNCSEEVRARAEAMHDVVARQTLLKIAEEYVKLAERAARRAQEE
jgi:hypothetical protein